MLIPTWITLKRLPLHFFSVAQEIAATLGRVLGKDAQNSHFKDPRFCVALDTSQGWKTEIEIEDRNTGKLISILVDYANLPIRCRYCNDLNHQVSACPQRSGSAQQLISDPRDVVKNQAPQHPPAAMAPTKPTVDEDGFTSTSRHRRQTAQRAPPEFRSLHPQVAPKSTPAAAPGEQGSGSEAPTEDTEDQTRQAQPDRPPTPIPPTWSGWSSSHQ